MRSAVLTVAPFAERCLQDPTSLNVNEKCLVMSGFAGPEEGVGGCERGRPGVLNPGTPVHVTATDGIHPGAKEGMLCDRPGRGYRPPRPAVTAGTLNTYSWGYGAVVAHLPCMQGVRGSNPLSSTRRFTLLDGLRSSSPWLAVLSRGDAPRTPPRFTLLDGLRSSSPWLAVLSRGDAPRTPRAVHAARWPSVSRRVASAGGSWFPLAWGQLSRCLAVRFPQRRRRYASRRLRPASPRTWPGRRA